VSEDHQWRQLGSIVNAVLIDAKTKAIRTGAIAKAPQRPLFRAVRQGAGASAQKELGNGFLAAEARPAEGPVQLELPFGITANSQQPILEARAPRSARLI
jgi:hypothetical protein